MSNPRYTFVEERPMADYLCPDCDRGYQIVIRTYLDKQRQQNGKEVVIETSVRTSCSCVQEYDMFADPNFTPPF